MQYSINWLQVDLEKKRIAVSKTAQGLAILRALVIELKNSKDYQDIENKCKKQLNNILNNKREILLAAVMAAIEILRTSGGRVYNLVLSSEYDDPELKAEVLNMAERVYDRLLNASLSSLAT